MVSEDNSLCDLIFYKWKFRYFQAAHVAVNFSCPNNIYNVLWKWREDSLLLGYSGSGELVTVQVTLAVSFIQAHSSRLWSQPRLQPQVYRYLCWGDQSCFCWWSSGSYRWLKGTWIPYRLWIKGKSNCNKAYPLQHL